MTDEQRLDRARKRLIRMTHDAADAIDLLRDQSGYRAEWLRLRNVSGELTAIRAQILVTTNRANKRGQEAAK